MKSIFKTIAISALVSATAFAGGYGKDYKSLCANTKKEAKAKVSTMDHEEALRQMGTPLFAASPEGCSKIKSLIGEKNAYLVDARSKASRGKLKAPTIKIVGDYADPSGHQFKPGLFEKLATKQLKRKGRTIASNDDLKKINFIIFCNSVTCYRNTQAACSLKEMGYDPSKIFMAVDGYEALREKCLN